MVTGNDVMYDTILGELREADLSGGTSGSGGYADSAGFAYTAGELQSGATVNGATVTFTNIPQSAVADLETALSEKSDIVSGGYRIGVTSSGGSVTIDQDKWFPITNVTGASVTMQPGEAYVIQATTAAVTINTTTVPANQYGLESHLEIFVANTGYVVTGSNVVLAQALEPDSVNNCVVRFHDGMAIISMEDHIAGYVVTVNAASGAGSLNYGLATASNGYISINASLNGQTLDLGGVVTSAGEKHVVGNGYTDTILSGGITCTSKTTFSYLGMGNVVNSGGTMTLGDVYIPIGSTVAVSGGGLAVEKVTGAGSESVIDLGETNVIIPNGTTASASGCTIIGGSAAFKPFSCGLMVDNCTISNNGASGVAFCGGVICYNTLANPDHNPIRINNSLITGNIGGAAAGLYVFKFDNVVLSGSTVTGNTATTAGVFGDIELQSASLVTASDCTLGKVGVIQSSVLTLAGSNVVDTIGFRAGLSGFVTISSGASINLTSSINPGGGITVLTGGCTVNGVTVEPGTYTSIVSSGGSAVINQ